MSMEVLPVYSKLFSSDNTPTSADWESFRTKPYTKDIVHPTQIDFCVTTKVRSWQDVAYTVLMIVIKIVLFPWIIYEGIKSLVGWVAMKFILPAQLHSKFELDDYRNVIIRDNQDLIIRHVSLQKDGINFRGLLLGRKENILNGNWAIHSVGNNAPIEATIPTHIQPYLESTPGSGFNVLLINPPNVGRSEGSANPETMGHAQEIGISFLESAVKAKKIVVTGQSIGGASIGEAILRHEFKPNIEYLVIRLMTFDKLSHVAQLLAGKLGSWVLNRLGYEMDNIASSRKLAEKNIPEIVIQAEGDEIIGRAGLLDALKREGITKNKSFHVIPDEYHNYFPHQELKQFLFKSEPTPTPMEQPIAQNHSILGKLVSLLPKFSSSKKEEAKQ